MKKRIDIESWNRKEHYLFFSKFEEPFFGVTSRVDVTNAYTTAQQEKTSFFLYYLYRALKAVNQIENFRYRIVDEKVYEFETINSSPTIKRPNGTFGFSYIDYHKEEHTFYKNALKEIERVQQSTSLLPAVSGENVIHFSALPWIDFTSLSHARSFSRPDSCPKISFGKVITVADKKEMAVSVHGHHGLMDGYHIGQFLELFQSLLNE